MTQDQPKWQMPNWQVQGIRLLATGLGAGLLRPGPGTFGTLVGLPLVYFLGQQPPLGYMIGAIVVMLLAIAVAEIYQLQMGGHDRQEVVIDEIVGIVITMTWLPLTWQAFLLGFVIFRILDIWKPFPIRMIDRKVRGGLGVVLDDVAAGLIANFLLQLIYTKTNWLGSQLVLT